MVQSMTGFGKASCEYNGKKIVVEAKSLNGKQIDIFTRIPALYREREVEIRSFTAQGLERGKVDVTIYFDNSSGKDVSSQLNAAAVASYYNQIRDLGAELSLPEPKDWLTLLVNLPDALTANSMQEADEAEWLAAREVLQQAIERLTDFRKQEGKALEAVFRAKIARIGELLAEVPLYEPERVERIKCRLNENLQTLSDKIAFDTNRLEQELIFYVEKLDVSEEKVRLGNHLNYFIETMEREHASGKKLGFIAQEMGREINTLGSKANHSEMQRIVVMMKDELEQIKEQVLNVL